MDQSGCLRSHRSSKSCRNRARHKRADQAPQLSCSTHKDDDWERDPKNVNDASKQRGEREVSTSSVTSDLSLSIQGCSLRRSVPHTKKEYADHQSCLHRPKDSAWMSAKDPKGHWTPPCPQVHSSSHLAIERSSVFNRNAAEILHTFLSEKVRAWASDDSQLSNSYENMETPQEPPSHGRCRRRTEKAHTGLEQTSRRQNLRWPVPAKGMVVQRVCSAWDNDQSDIYYDQCLRHHPLSEGETPGGPRDRQEGTAMSSSARILPQCRISHVQSCEACQAFNQERPAGKEALYEECWPPLGEEDGDRETGRKRTGASSQRQLSKVQQWLEQTPLDQPPGHPKVEKQVGTAPTSPQAPGSCAACGSWEPKEGDPWGRAGDAGDRWSPENPAGTRHGRKPHRARRPGHQPVARIISCDNTSTSPAACSCLFCERQKARAKSSPAKQEGKKGTDLSAHEVAVQLQAENRVPRIVEAFERRCLREAKMVERDRPSQSSRHRDLEQRSLPAKSRGDSKQGHPPQGGPKARKPRSKEEQVEGARPGVGPEGYSHGMGQPVGKKPSFLDRLRGLY